MKMKKNDRAKKIIKSIVCILVSMSYLANCMVIQAIAECTLDKSELDEYADNICIYADTTNIQSNNKNIVSKIDIYDKDKNSILDGIMYNMDNDTISNENVVISNDSYLGEKTIYSSGTTDIYVGRCSINDMVVSEESINIGTSEINGNNMILCSKKGNININASNIELQGIIYAPEGKVSINGDSVIFDGIIIADTVEIFAGNILLINTNTELYTRLANYKKSNMTLFSMYYSYDDNKIGVSYDDDYKKIDLYYRYDEQSFQCVENYNISNHLELPAESSYLEGYLEVVDKFGNKSISNIVTFYNDGNCYETVKDSDEDGISDAYEIRDLKTSPYNEDTDGDGIIDAYDIYEMYNDEYYDTKIVLDKEIYNEITTKAGDIFYLDKSESTTDMNVCYMKKSVLDVVNSSYNTEGILVTSVYNKVTGNEVLRFYEDKYIQYIYNNKEQRVATLACDGMNNTVNMYNYEKGNMVSIMHNGFTYELIYNQENISQIDIAGNPYINYEYDNEGHITKAIYGNGYIFNMEYDEIGNILKVSDSEKVLYEWIYGEHYVISTYIDHINDIVTNYYYGEEGQLNKIDDNKGRSIEYTYEPEKIQKKFIIGDKEYVSDFLTGDICSVCTFNNNLSITNNEEKQTFNYEGMNVLSINKKNENNSMIKTIGNDDYKYVFSENGNIIEEYINGELVNSYEYNNFAQMTRANSKNQNITTVYEYDAGGNITCKKYYNLTFETKTEDLMGEIDTVVYKYDSKWKDLLIEYNDEHIEYDSIGNPITYINGIKYEWNQGRDLYKIVNKNGEIISYTYNSDGIRTKKVMGDKIVEYYIEGDDILYEKGVDYEICYIYDLENEIVGFEYNGNTYIYKKNGLNDIIGIIDIYGNEIVSYEYDTWGKITKISGNEDVARLNPFRFKSYYFDEESGLYYLNSRYYDADTGRFINADKQIETYVGIHSNNMFTYCENSPVTRQNSTGEASTGVSGLTYGFLTGCSMQVYTPKYNTLYSWIPEKMRYYNCYGFVINEFNRFAKPGEYSEKTFKLDLNVIVENAIADMKKRGFKQVREIKVSDISKVNGVIAAVRIGTDDFHWMRYCSYASGWLHKPGESAIIKLKGEPYDYSVWKDERYKGDWFCTNTTYTSTIRYIAFK